MLYPCPLVYHPITRFQWRYPARLPRFVDERIVRSTMSSWEATCEFFFQPLFMDIIEATILANNRPSIYCCCVKDVFVKDVHVPQAPRQPLIDALEKYSRLPSIFWHPENCPRTLSPWLQATQIQPKTWTLFILNNTECHKRYLRSTITA